MTVLFRRDPSRDRQRGSIHFEGYQPFWPNGHPVAVGLDAFCKHGQRLLGLGKHLAGCNERLVELLCFPLSGREDPLTRLPGHRVRRFYVERQENCGRIHFLDGTPTEMVFRLGHDEHRVVEWIGLAELQEGEQQWVDVAARVVGAPAPPHPHRLPSSAFVEA